jgi:NAD(P)-dependent dehydrogenase (short-subunit alcohol dehydrogenase family)
MQIRGVAWYCTQAVLPAMIEQASGSVVNISPVNALMGFGPEHLQNPGSWTEPQNIEQGMSNGEVSAVDMLAWFPDDQLPQRSARFDILRFLVRYSAVPLRCRALRSARIGDTTGH